jgi:hypothetical protein
MDFKKFSRVAIASLLFSFPLYARLFLFMSGSTASGVSGPETSRTHAVASFGNTVGNVLLDATLGSGQGRTVSVPIGDEGGPSIVPGLAFSGADAGGAVPANTGLAAGFPAVAGRTYIDFILNGTGYMNVQAYPGTRVGSLVTYQVDLVRPDTSFTTIFGRANNSFGPGRFYQNLFHGLSGGEDYTTRSLFTASSPWNTGAAVRAGIGFNENNAAEFYFNLRDDSTGTFGDLFSVSTTMPGTTLLSAPADTAANSTAARSLMVSGVNKTGGTGDGGDLVLSGGTSAGGGDGDVFIPADNSSPSDSPTTRAGFSAIRVDTLNNRLCVRISSAWKCAALE